MKNLLLFVLLFFCLFNALADMPGHIYREPVNVQFKNIISLKGYHLYISDYDTLIEITTDTTYIITASQGSPHCILFFAKNNKGSTDSMNVCEYDQQNTLIEFNGIAENKMVFTDISLPLEHAKEDENRKSNSGDLNDESFFAKNTTLCISLSIAALLALIILFIYYKRKKRT
ncbi:MAG: hypothetical protein ABI653_00990 [Bacteroidota bacterium]